MRTSESPAAPPRDRRARPLMRALFGRSGKALTLPSPGVPGEGKKLSHVLAILVVVAWVQCASVAQPARPATAPATQEASAEAPPGENFLQLLMKGGWFMLPIAAASLVGLALIIERAVALRKRRIKPRKFLAKLADFGDDRNGAYVYARETETAAGRVAAAGLARLPAGNAAADRAMEEAGAMEIYKLRRNMRMLYGVSAAAPLLGLLGTVAGMIEAFRVTSVSRGLGRPELLAAGIYEALVCTMAGLMVCIPTLFAYYYFITKIEGAVADMNETAGQIARQFYFTEERGRKADAGMVIEPAHPAAAHAARR